MHNKGEKEKKGREREEILNADDCPVRIMGVKAQAP